MIPVWDYAKQLKEEALDEGNNWHITISATGTKTILEDNGCKTIIQPNGNLTIENGNFIWKVSKELAICEFKGSKSKSTDEWLRVYNDGTVFSSISRTKFSKDTDGNMVEVRNNIKKTFKLDGTVVTENADRSDIKTQLSNGRIHRIVKYPEGGFLEQGYLAPGKVFKPGDIYARDIGVAKELATKKIEELKPTNVNDLEKIVGPLKQTDVDELATITLERLGLRVEAELFGDPQLIRWIEFYPV